MPEEILCTEGRWYEVAGIFLRVKEVLHYGVKVEVSPFKPKARVHSRRSRILDSMPAPELQLPAELPRFEITEPGTMNC